MFAFCQGTGNCDKRIVLIDMHVDVKMCTYLLNFNPILVILGQRASVLAVGTLVVVWAFLISLSYLCSSPLSLGDGGI